MEEVEGIVVSETNYNDSSKILNILTYEHGIIGVMARGCRRLKSPLRAYASKLTYGKFIIYYKKDKISTLKEISVTNPFLYIKSDIKALSYSYYLLELAYGVYRQNNNQKIIDILIDSLIKINDKYDPLVIMNIVEIKYLYYLGVMPRIDECAICGSKENIITIDSFKGGLICQNCYKDEPIVNSKTIKLIRIYYYVDLKKINKINVSKDISHEINLFLDDYYTRYTGLYLKSKDFIKSLEELN